jgi:hypothetical protein
MRRPNGNAKGISWAWIGFDRDARLFIDNRACHSLAEGSVAFEVLLLLAEPAVRQAAPSVHFMWSTSTACANIGLTASHASHARK